MFAKKLIASSILAITLASGCSDNAEQGIDIGKHAQRAESYTQQGQFRAAMIEARNIIQAEPQSATGHLLLAKIFNELGQGKLASEQLESIVTKPNEDYYLTLSRAYLLRGKYRSAESILQTQQDLLKAYDSAQYNLQMAEALTGLQRGDEAKPWLQQVLQTDPGNNKAQLGLALIAAQEQNFDLADRHINAILGMTPNYTDALILKANIALAENKLDLAEDALSTALSTLPNTDIISAKKSRVLETLANILTRQGRSAEALVYTKILSEAYPEAQQIQTQYSQAIELYKQGKFDEAEKLLLELQSKSPNNDNIGTLLGVINYMQGDLDVAAQQFDHSVDMETANPLVRHIYASTQMKLRQPEQVLALLEEDIATSSNPDTLGLYGIAALSAGKPTKGIDALKRALALNPDKVRLHLAIANYHNNKSNPDKKLALQELEIAFQRTPADPFVRAELVKQYLSMDKKGDAERLVKQSLQDYPKDPQSQIIAGIFYSLEQAHDKALDHFTEATRLAPDLSQAQLAKAQAEIALKQWDQAINSFQQLIHSNPNLVAAYKGLVSTYELKGDPEEGIQQLKALTDVPTSQLTAKAVLAEYYARNNQFKLALQSLPESADTNNNPYIKELRIGILYNLANQNIAQENYSAARSATMQAIKQAPEDSRILSQLVNIEISDGKFSEAQKTIEKISQLTNNTVLVQVLSGDLMLAKNNLPEAETLYRAAWKESPNDATGNKIYALFENSGQQEKLDAFLREWNSQLPLSLQPDIYRAIKAQEAQDNKEAITRYQLVLEKNPYHPVALNNLAWLYFTEKDARAASIARQAYELSPNNPAIVDTYGWILFNQGDTAQAKTLLSKAYQLAPDNQDIAEHYRESHPTN